MTKDELNAQLNLELNTYSQQINFDKVLQLIERGDGIDTLDDWKNTAFMCAVGANDIPATTRLIELGAGLNSRGKGGRTPLMMACHEGFLKIISILLEAGADSSLMNNYGATAMYIARYQGFEYEAKFIEDFVLEGEVSSSQERSSSIESSFGLRS